MNKHYEIEKNASSTLSQYSPTLRERIKNQKVEMENRIKEIDEAIALLDRNPDFERLQDLLVNKF
jgi:uncharacterized membrane protein YfbV (UPF0208 family)